MKAFTIYQFQSGWYRISFCYRNGIGQKLTQRFSDYRTKKETQKAAKGFLKRGYKLVESREDLK